MPRSIADAIAGEAWVVDGSFSGRAFDLTLARADTLIVIERPRWLCLWCIAWRSAFGVGGTRPELPEGCPEQFSWNLMQQAWRYNADRRPRIEADRLSDHKPPEVPARHSQQFPGFLGRQPATTVLLKPIFKTRHKRLP